MKGFKETLFRNPGVRSQLTRSKRARAAFIFMLAAAAASPAMAGFTGGPSVRVTLNSKVEIRWIANFVGDGIALKNEMENTDESLKH
jgi:hypothetical protein